MSTVASPIRCDACAVEQHRRLPLLPFIGFAAAFLLTGVFAVIAQAWLPPDPLVGLVVVPVLATGLAWETFLYRRGEMVATVRWRKRLAQMVLYAPFAVALAGFAFLIFQAAP